MYKELSVLQGTRRERLIKTWYELLISEMLHCRMTIYSKMEVSGKVELQSEPKQMGRVFDDDDGGR